mmetsp:Transcript_36750/g.57448  ORF Transcript_36750/g.57448 Transcript_36750/m.57448 type:complete len:439 (-) Transcript_36750:1529-2845(-)
MHVLIMEFLGVRGSAAPKLKDANLELAGWTRCYFQCFQIVRTLYHECRLVHGDLSEYNLLYHQSRVFLIDVSQSVGPDHPHAMTFLKEDVQHISTFFRARGVSVASLRVAFDLIVRKDISSEDAMDLLEKQRTNSSHAPDSDFWIEPNQIGIPGVLRRQAAADVEDAVFMSSYMPQSLSDLGDMEEYLRRAARGGAGLSLRNYGVVTGMNLSDARHLVQKERDELQTATTDFGTANKASDILRRMGLDSRGRALEPLGSRGQKSSAFSSSTTLSKQSSDSDSSSFDISTEAASAVDQGWEDWYGPKELARERGGLESFGAKKLRRRQTQTVAQNDEPKDSSTGQYPNGVAFTENESDVSEHSEESSSAASPNPASSEAEPCEALDGCEEVEGTSVEDSDQARQQKKARKQAVREANRLRRQQKLPKKLKRRAMRKTSH